MPIEIGQVEALFRYPVKSMRGEALEAATLGWHGIDGDRRFAFRRLDVSGGFPWLSASKLPELIHFTPQRREDGNGEALREIVRAERVESHRTEGLRASVYHLVDRGAAPLYLRALHSVALAVKVAPSGPWPAWSFAPEALR